MRIRTHVTLFGNRKVLVEENTVIQSHVQSQNIGLLELI